MLELIKTKNTMKVSKKEIIIRLIRQVYDYSDEIIHLKEKIKELENGK